MHTKVSEQAPPNRTYVVDCDFKLVYLDEAAAAALPHVPLGTTCYSAFHDAERPCADCPLLTPERNRVSPKALYDERSGAWLELSSVEVSWPGHGRCTLLTTKGLDRPKGALHHAKGDRHPQYLIERDPLTGLYASNAFFEHAEAFLKANPGNNYELVYFDVEHFLVFNERFGRRAGDAILRTIALQLKRIEEEFCGLAGYFGGDDFVIILPQGTTIREGLDKRIDDAIDELPYDLDCLISIGVRDIDVPGLPISTLCDHAMTAMNSTKGNYSTRIAWYNSDMTEALTQEPEALNEIQLALENKEFVVFYQPKYNIVTEQVVGFEALVRWQHPKRGLVFPGDFIPLLEKTGLIANLDLFVWEQTCKQLRAWLDYGKPTLPISVNISRADLKFMDVSDVLEDLVERYGLDRSLLELEITETTFVEDAKAIKTVNDLKDRGFTVMMDDFGSGYSSLNMLKELNVDVVKIDMRFLDLTDSTLHRGESILESIIGMAEFIGVPVIAEGAETREQVDFLKSVNCDYAQGFYFAKPMPLESIELLISEKDRLDRDGIRTKQIDIINPADLIKNYVTNRSVLDNILGGMAVYEAKEDSFRLLQANSRYFQITKMNPFDLGDDGLQVWKDVHPDDLPFTLGLFSYAEQHPVSGSEGVVRRYMPTGELMWVRMRVFFLSKAGGRRIFFGMLTDVTDQVDKEKALESSKAALDEMVGLSLIEEIPQGNTSITQEATSGFIRSIPSGMIGFYRTEEAPILFANDELVSMLGYHSYADFMESNEGALANIVHPDDLDAVQQSKAVGKAEGRVFNANCRLLSRTGDYLWVAVRGKTIRTSKNSLVMILSLIDINETMILQQRVSLEDKMLKSLIVQAGLNMWTLDAKSSVVMFRNVTPSSLIYRFLPLDGKGIIQDDTLELPLADVMSTLQLSDEDKGKIQAMLEAAAFGESSQCKVWIRADDDELLFVSLVCETVFDANGNPLNIVGYMKDITEIDDEVPTELKERRVLKMMKGQSVHHWCINLTRALNGSEESPALNDAGQPLDSRDNGGFYSLYDELADVICTEKDQDSVRDFLNLQSMLHSFDQGQSICFLDYRQVDEGVEAWMELRYHLVQFKDSNDLYAYIYMMDIDEKKRQEIDLRLETEHDQLTGLYNRKGAIERIEKAIMETIASESSAMLMIIDLDCFRRINDLYGHARGDEALITVSDHLKRLFRKNDIICRWGGDEFLIFCQGVSLDVATKKANAICDEFGTLPNLVENNIAISVSAGIAMAPRHGTSFEALFKRADVALFAVKAKNKSDYKIYNEEMAAGLIDAVPESAE